jgi:hypothetical protein
VAAVLYIATFLRGVVVELPLGFIMVPFVVSWVYLFYPWCAL